MALKCIICKEKHSFIKVVVRSLKDKQVGPVKSAFDFQLNKINLITNLKIKAES